jgi:octaprenyl-diphosphate synthase
VQGVLEIPESLQPVSVVLMDALLRVEQRFDEQLTTDLRPVRELVNHVEKYRGKMLRPVISLLSGLACHPQPDRPLEPSLLGERHIVVAAVCEMVHMATLVHDDVLDEADHRRGGLTVNRLRGNEPAVMLGDYLIAAAYELCTQLGEASTAGIVGRMSMAMCAGELLQLHHRGDFAMDEATYFEIVERKTGALIGAAASLGAIASQASPAVVASMDRVGRDLGIAFQIQDDLLDLRGDEQTVGKSVGKDVEKSKLTLPLIHHLRSCSQQEREASITLLESAAAGEGSARSQLARRAETTGSIAAARTTAIEYVQRARTAIASLHPSPAREVLDLLAAAVIDRDK